MANIWHGCDVSHEFTQCTGIFSINHDALIDLWINAHRTLIPCTARCTGWSSSQKGKDLLGLCKNLLGFLYSLLHILCDVRTRFSKQERSHTADSKTGPSTLEGQIG